MISNPLLALTLNSWSLACGPCGDKALFICFCFHQLLTSHVVSVGTSQLLACFYSECSCRPWFFGPAGSLERTVRRIFPGSLEGDTCRGDIHWQGQFSGFFFKNKFCKRGVGFCVGFGYRVSFGCKKEYWGKRIERRERGLDGKQILGAGVWSLISFSHGAWCLDSFLWMSLWYVLYAFFKMCVEVQFFDFLYLVEALVEVFGMFSFIKFHLSLIWLCRMSPCLRACFSIASFDFWFLMMHWNELEISEERKVGKYWSELLRQVCCLCSMGFEGIKFYVVFYSKLDFVIDMLILAQWHP